ncbi:hypothetical protein LIER_26668 [Lithospermum erythrorhizon]|uniref:Reverse transcriptase domain-containing protein n=1 Tax=Lithospermum erythrorhizon TaxID=34254 RepID=A0AAV3RCE5_LITER
MDYFSELLKSNAVEGVFTFYPGCKDIGLINISFADDLFVLCGASVDSMKFVKENLRIFGEQPGLKLNLSKSTCYFAGVSENVELMLSNVLGIPCSSLPVRHLGIPLTTKQLKARDCKVLVEKTTLSKDEGGLGLKGLHDWNRACMAKHVWNLSERKKTLWIKWINRYRLKGQSFWGIKERSIDSWIWRKLLQLRKILRPYAKYQIGDGTAINYFLLEIRWLVGRRLTNDIQLCKFSLSVCAGRDRDQLSWFGSNKHHTTAVWNHIRESPGRV